jgi:peptide/nickel transport system permease protein
MASFIIGLISILISINTQSFNLTLFFECIGPFIAGGIGFIARRKITWLIEREKSMFRELRFTFRMITRNKLTLLAIGVIILFYTITVLSPYIVPYDPYETHLKEKLSGPSAKYLLGTDSLGRDIFSRLIYGTQTSMVCGIIVVTISVAIGLPIGSIAGYLGGKVDEILMRFTDIVMAFPGLTLSMFMAYILGRGLFSAIVGLSMTTWCTTARLVRGVILSEKEKEYVMAARAIGKSDKQILFGEILPNSIHPVICWSTMTLGTVIISVAGLSFVGVGIQPPIPDWGVMISEGRQYLLDQPLYSIFPGLLIITVVLAFVIVGDTVRDALDPSLRRER